MKRFCRNIILFAAVAGLGYWLLLAVLGSTGLLRNLNYRLGNYGHLCLRAKDVENYHDVDVLFLGSSHAYRTFDTRFYARHGLRTFNFGSSNQTPLQTYVLLRRYIDSLNPRFVVFEVHPDIMSNDGVEGAVDQLSNIPMSFPLSFMALRMRNAKVLNTWLYATYRDGVWGAVRRFEEDTLIDGMRYVRGGFCEMADSCYLPQVHEPQPIVLNPQQMKALRACLRLLADRHIPYMLVEVQGSQSLRYTNHDEFESAMRSLGDYRYCVLPLVDSMHFFDEDHLNKAGIKIFNEYFIGEL